MSLFFIKTCNPCKDGSLVTYVKSLWCKRSSAHSPNFVTSPTSQLILQPLRRFTYITAHSPTRLLLHLHHSSFSNPSFASPTSQVLHLRHLASRPWIHVEVNKDHQFILSCNLYLLYIQGRFKGTALPAVAGGPIINLRERH